MELTVDSPVTPDQMKLISAHAFSLDDPCIPSFLPSGTVDRTSPLHLGAIFNIKSTSKKHNSVTNVARKGHLFTVSELKLAIMLLWPQLAATQVSCWSAHAPSVVITKTPQVLFLELEVKFSY